MLAEFNFSEIEKMTNKYFKYYTVKKLLAHFVGRLLDGMKNAFKGQVSRDHQVIIRQRRNVK